MFTNAYNLIVQRYKNWKKYITEISSILISTIYAYYMLVTISQHQQHQKSFFFFRSQIIIFWNWDSDKKTGTDVTTGSTRGWITKNIQDWPTGISFINFLNFWYFLLMLRVESILLKSFLSRIASQKGFNKRINGFWDLVEKILF